MLEVRHRMGGMMSNDSQTNEPPAAEKWAAILRPLQGGPEHEWAREFRDELSATRARLSAAEQALKLAREEAAAAWRGRNRVEDMKLDNEGSALAEVATLRAAISELAPVVRAAIAWRASDDGILGNTLATLNAAVDALSPEAWAAVEGEKK
jgi:hypothetical protein